jgi:MFS family permease
VWTVGIALMVDTVGKEGLGQAIGYVSMSLSVGTMAGPLLGGVLYQDGGYYSVFGLAFGLIGVDIFLRLVLIEKRHAARWITEMKPLSSSEQQGKERASVGAITDSPALSSDPQPETSEKPVARSPLRQTASLLSSYRLIVSLWGYFVISLVLTSFDSVLPIFVQETFGWQQTGQGLIFIALMVPHILDPVTGFIIDRYPWTPRYLTAAGFLCIVPVATLLRLVKENTMHDKIVLCALLALLGCCIALAMTPIVTEVFNAVKEKEDKSPNIFGRGGAMALAFGLSNVGFAAGSLIGPFFAGFIRQSAGWGTMGWAMGLIAGVSAIPNLLFVGGWILRKPNPSKQTESESS